MPQTLVQKFGVAAVRGVARNKSIVEFQLEPYIRDQRVVDGMLAQLTADKRRKFRVGRDKNRHPSIELGPVGEGCIVIQCMRYVSQVFSSLYQPMYMYQPLHCCLNAAVQSVECSRVCICY